MPPFDLPPGDLSDALRADFRRPGEAREASISKPPDGDGREHLAQHPHIDPPSVPGLPEPPLPPGRWILDQPRRRPQYVVDGSAIFGVQTPLRARALESCGFTVETIE